MLKITLNIFVFGNEPTTKRNCEKQVLIWKFSMITRNFQRCFFLRHRCFSVDWDLNTPLSFYIQSNYVKYRAAEFRNRRPAFIQLYLQLGEVSDD